MDVMADGEMMVQAEGRLARAVEQMFMEPQDFFSVFRCEPHRAIVVLRDEPERLGRLRTYLGKTAVETARREMLAAARGLYRLTHGRAAVLATRKVRKRSKSSGVY